MTTPYKSKQFKAFIALIESDQSGHWVEIAKALNVDKNTILAWKKLPEAEEAIQKSIVRALGEMEKSGKNDWRMWEAKLKMLGINPATVLSLDTGDPIEELLNQYGLKPKVAKDDGKAPPAVRRPRKSTT